MKKQIATFLIVLLGLTINAFTETVTFDSDKVGIVPDGWIAGVTGSGTPKWLVENDPTAPSKSNILKQEGQGTFPWCVKKDVSLADGFVEVKFKPISGAEDQAGGVVWRWKDGDNYYIARANALEDNIALFYMSGGKRRVIKSVDVKVPTNEWGVLRVEFNGEEIKVFLNGKSYIVLNDNHISGAGKIGVWTKADSVTAFDDFSYGENK